MDRLIENVLDDDIIKVPDIYWTDLLHVDANRITAIGALRTEKGFRIQMMGKFYLIMLREKCVLAVDTGTVVEDPILVLILLVYLLNAQDLSFEGTWVGVKDLKTAHFFRGPHELRTQPLVECFGERANLFQAVGEKVGGEKMDMGDAAFFLTPLPKIRLAYILWEGEEGVFPSEVNVLLDAGIEKQVPPDTIWALVGWMTNYLCDAACNEKS